MTESSAKRPGVLLVLFICLKVADTEVLPQAVLEWGLAEGALSAAPDLSLVRHEPSTHPINDGKTYWGFSARQSIAAGKLLLSVQHSSVLNHKLALESEEFRPVVHALHDMQPTTIVALFLLHEARKGQRSSWATYISTLPRKQSNFFYWTEKELQVLSGSPVLEEWRIRQSLHSGEFKRIHPVAREMAILFGNKTVTQADYNWALSTIQARSFSIFHEGMLVATIQPQLQITHSACRQTVSIPSAGCRCGHPSA